MFILNNRLYQGRLHTQIYSNVSLNHFFDTENSPRYDPDEQDKTFHCDKFTLENNKKPKLKIGDVLSAYYMSGTIRHTRENEPDEIKKIPSVTKILKDTMSVESKLRLQIWEEKMVAQMGRHAFEKMKELNFKRGHRLHTAVGKYISMT